MFYSNMEKRMFAEIMIDLSKYTPTKYVNTTE